MTDDAPQALIDLAGVSVRLGGRLILPPLCWRLGPGEQWAVVGGNGSGKTTFLRLLAGLQWPAAGGPAPRWNLDRPTSSALAVREQIALVSAEQQLDYGRGEWCPTVRDVVAAGLFGERFLYRRPTAAEGERVATGLDRLGLSHLADRDPRDLSEGELRQVLLVRAMLGEPRVLLLDEPVVGLDAPARRRILELLDHLSERVSLVCAVHRRADLPGCVTHVARLEDGRLTAGRRGEVPVDLLDGEDAPPPASPVARGELVAVEGAEVRLGGRAVLRELNLTVRAGEVWRVEGPNGAGKSTLLRLLAGELRPALGGHIRWFGRPGLWSIWDLRRRLGAVSWDLHQRYEADCTVAEVVASGLFGTIGLHQRLTEAERRTVAETLARCGLTGWAERSYRTLSFGQQRRALVARALVGRPDLLLLDEALEGLDAAATATLARLIAEEAARGCGLVVVGHHQDPLTVLTTHRLNLTAGRATGG